MVRRDRLIRRVQRGSIPRAYGNFRDYADVGGKRCEALLVPGTRRAATDEVTARMLIAHRLAMYEQLRHDRLKQILDVGKPP